MSARRPDVLATIVAATTRGVEVRRDARTPGARSSGRAAAWQPRGAALLAPTARGGAGRRPNVIAECKRRSPSRGVLRADYDPVAIARQYAAAGAAAISVLTEPTFFDGALDHLRAVRAAVPTPLLRKDFIVDEYQMLEARAAGADAVLLIVAALDDATLRAAACGGGSRAWPRWSRCTTAEELARAQQAGARARSASTTATSRRSPCRSRPRWRSARRSAAGVVGVAESGIRSRADIDAPDRRRLSRVPGRRALHEPAGSRAPALARAASEAPA